MLFGDVIKLDFVNDFDRHLFLCQNMSLQGMQINIAQLNLTLKRGEQISKMKLIFNPKDLCLKDWIAYKEKLFNIIFR